MPVLALLRVPHRAGRRRPISRLEHVLESSVLLIPHRVQPLGQCGYAPLKPGGGGRRPLVLLARRVPFPPRLGTVLPGLIERALGLVETALRGVVRFPGLLAGGVGRS